MPPRKSPVNERQRQEHDKAREKHPATRLHPGVVGRRRINQERANGSGGRHRENMFRGVGQTTRLRVPIVTADDIERLDDYDYDDAIDQNELERSREKLVAPDVTYDSIKQHPANN